MNTTEFLLGGAVDSTAALADTDGEHTYGALRRAVAAVASRLVELELPAGSVVALQAPNSLFWVASYLAALDQGFVVAPLSTTVTPSEAASRAEWLGARVVFAGRQQQRRMAPYLSAGPLWITEDVIAQLPDSVQPPAPVDVDPGSDALLEFTSGTSGRPRVVRITHRNIRANTESILAYLELTADDRMLVVLPFSYAFGASLLHTHLRVGASLVIQPSLAYPESVVERMVAERCTGFAGVPSSFHMLLRNSTFRSRPVPSLRQIQQAGGKLSGALIKELAQAQPQADVFVMYGQTEATARLSYLPPAELLTKSGSIGRGIPGVDLRVVDAAGLAVRPGEVGEIIATGANISPGYLDDEAATALKMPDGELRTGDLATVDEDGYIYIVDRAEDFIKSWGHRIASQDIESVVMQIPELIGAAAVGVPDDAAGERLELVVVRHSDSILDVAGVLTHCREHLARHMVPEAVHFTAQLPLNANGKVAKAELRSLCLSLAQPAPGGGRDS